MEFSNEAKNIEAIQSLPDQLKKLVKAIYFIDDIDNYRPKMPINTDVTESILRDKSKRAKLMLQLCQMYKKLILRNTRIFYGDYVRKGDIGPVHMDNNILIIMSWEFYDWKDGSGDGGDSANAFVEPHFHRADLALDLLKAEQDSGKGMLINGEDLYQVFVDQKLNHSRYYEPEDYMEQAHELYFKTIGNYGAFQLTTGMPMCQWVDSIEDY